MNKSSLWAVIVVLITIIIWMTRCNNNGTIISKIDTVSDTSYIHDTLTVKGKTKIKPVPVPYYVHDTLIDSTGKIVIVNVTGTVGTNYSRSCSCRCIDFTRSTGRSYICIRICSTIIYHTEIGRAHV